MVRSLRRFLVLGAVALGFASSARADFSLQIDAAGFDLNGGAEGTAFQINDGDSFDQDGAVNGSIRVDAPQLNAILAGAGTGFAFTTLGSNIISGDPAVSAVNTSGIVRRTGDTGNGLITVTASANDFVIPGTGPALLGSTASDTFGGLGSTRSFQSFFDAADVQFGLTTPSPLLVFAPTADDPSTSGGAPDTVVNVTGPFALTNVTSIFLAPSASDQFTGRTTIRAVPEPASLGMLLLGGSALAYGIRRRRAVTA